MEGKIRKIQQMFRKKTCSCKELTQQYLHQLETRNPELGALVCQTVETALSAADKVDQRLRSGETLFPLEGIPMVLKDNICTRGISTTCCSKMLLNFVPIYDAAIWEQLKGQNAVLLGKSNMDEFAMGSSGESSCFGGTCNPHDTRRVAGGSSGGGAAAVSGNLAVYALGSDTGGSVRQPASFTGVVGLKPTYGTVSRYGLVAYCSSFDQIGPITSTVEDAAIVFDAISQRDRRDSTSVGRRGGACAEKLEESINGRTIGLVQELCEGAEPAVQCALEEAQKVLEGLGARIIKKSIPILKHALSAYYILACAEASSNLGRYDGIRFGYRPSHYGSIEEEICRSRSEGFGKEVQRRILLGTYVLSAGYYEEYYQRAQQLRAAITRELEAALAGCDLLLSPVTASTAFVKGEERSSVETYHTDLCTVPANLGELPAISVPCGFDAQGLPIGMQLMGPRFGESTLLNVAYQYEHATGGMYTNTLPMGVRI